MNDLPIQTYESVVQQRDALEKKLADMAAENAALKNSSAYVIQDGEPPKRFFYHNDWFVAKVKGGRFAVLRPLPEEYSYDYTTIDGTYFRKDLILGWMQLPDTEYLPNVETPATDAFTRELMAKGVEDAASSLFGAGYSFDLLMGYAAQFRTGVNDAQ
ncbi:hypothetical protein [Hafnia paralvei]|uniref:hypothetical protein n=1 Tax=Hafnia paralvei TaxID=546367 RepID=UPI0024B93FF1|nr:hypothetical protein [Hafnia paralvei]